MYCTPSKGLIESWLNAVIASTTDDGEITSYTEIGKCFTKSFLDTNFKDKDVLVELHSIYNSELSALNPGIKFTTQI